MVAKGRFGLIIPEINSPLDRDLVEGAYEQAKLLGYDLTVYTGIYNCLREYRYDSYISGLENISRDIGISKSHLQRLYKHLFSTTIKDDVINSRIKKAQQLLLHTDMRISEIAEQCGYGSENHFMRQFKEKNLRTAAQFRKEHRELKA